MKTPLALIIENNIPSRSPRSATRIDAVGQIRSSVCRIAARVAGLTVVWIALSIRFWGRAVRIGPVAA